MVMAPFRRKCSITSQKEKAASPIKKINIASQKEKSATPLERTR